LIHHVYDERIVKKRPLLKWLYIVRYAMKYPCRECLVRAACINGCKPLAQFIWIYHQILTHMEQIIDTEQKTIIKHVVRFIYILIIALLILGILSIFGVPVKKLIRDPIINDDYRFNSVAAKYIERKDDP
jgi:hypothetical protein